MKPKSQVIKRMDAMEENIGNSSGAGEAVVVENADVRLFIKKYTEIETTDEYKIVFCGSGNQIIAQGMILFPYMGTAPNGVTIKRMRNKNLYNLPDIPFYIDVDFKPPSVRKEIFGKNIDVELRGVKFTLESATNTYATYVIDLKSFIKNTGESIRQIWNCSTAVPEYVGFTLAYEAIYPPGTRYNSTEGTTYISEFGYVDATLIVRTKDTDGYYSIETGPTLPVPFASKDEYDAAVSLTYEP